MGGSITFPFQESFTLLKKDSKEFQEIKKVFDDLIASAREGNVKGIMRHFSRNYLNSGRSRQDVEKQWAQILTYFYNLKLNHPIYSIEVSGKFARMRCEGLLMGKPRFSVEGVEVIDDLIVVDSWKLGFHNLIREDGEWKILGDQIPFETGMTFHPLF